MLTIRNNIFETNSSSSHSFSYYIDDGLHAPEECYRQLQPLIKDGTLTINGIMMGNPECAFRSLESKLAIVGVIIAATDNEKLKAVFEKVVKEYLPIIKEIKYNCILAGKNINASYNPYMLSTDVSNENWLDLDNNEEPESSEFNKVIESPPYMRCFLFGMTSSLEGGITY